MIAWLLERLGWRRPSSTPHFYAPEVERFLRRLP
jgi:hypothetical protein